jgi:hypothetical protein
MDRLVGLTNDVGLLSEEYDTVAARHVGNTPQALTHLAMVQAADWIARASESDSLRGRPAGPAVGEPRLGRRPVRRTGPAAQDGR